MKTKQPSTLNPATSPTTTPLPHPLHPRYPLHPYYLTHYVPRPLQTTALLATSNGSSVSVALFWRRRDANITQRLVYGTDAAGNRIDLVSARVENECGLLTFPQTQAPLAYVYWLPHNQSGNDAHLHFSWLQAPPGQVGLQRRRLDSLRPREGGGVLLHFLITSRRTARSFFSPSCFRWSTTWGLARPPVRLRCLPSRGSRPATPSTAGRGKT